MRQVPGAVVLLTVSLCCIPSTAQTAATASGQNSPDSKLQQGGATNPTTPSSVPLTPESQAKLINQVRHELVMLPYYGVFDNLTFRLEGRTVTLLGQVVQPITRSDAGNVVKRIEGVESVVNNIEVLPPSPADERIREQVYRAIYSYPPLFKYGGGAVPPIHIIVRSGRVNLEGVVDSETDKGMAGIQANQVPGTFQITNNLRVIKPTSDNKKDKKK